MSEEWKAIPEWEGYYEASTTGRIKSTKTGRILSPFTLNSGYKCTSLWRNNKDKKFLVHRLVMMTFGTITSELFVNHLNGIKTDNRFVNLEVCTRSENMKHAYKTGLLKKAKGEDAYTAVLKEVEVYEIWDLLKQGKLTQAEIGKLYGVTRHAVGYIKNKKSWKHLNLE